MVSFQFAKRFTLGEVLQMAVRQDEKMLVEVLYQTFLA